MILYKLVFVNNDLVFIFYGHMLAAVLSFSLFPTLFFICPNRPMPKMLSLTPAFY